MFEPIEVYISDKYTYQDYLKLDFKVDSPNNVWKKAIDIFKDRIETRYFLAIDKLMEKKDRYEMRKYGFAIVTLQCSLIDTLAKFRYGSDKQKNEERFENFLMENFIYGDNAKLFAERIYKDIRCGIVHSGATDNKSGLSCEMRELVSFLSDNKSISLDLIILQERLEKYFNKYIKQLKNEEEYELRKNFVNTMSEVCKAN